MIGIACDHAGVDLKNIIIEHLTKKDIPFKDYGAFGKESVHYPHYAQKVCKDIINNKIEKGILICATGIGISIAANRFKGIRCAICHDALSAQKTREHNDANVIAFGAKIVGEGHALYILDTFLNTPFSNDERHIKRINLIEEIEQEN